MAETPFRSLAPGDERDTLAIAAGRSERRTCLLEKNIRVVETLVGAPPERHLTFRGGTSLVEARPAVSRFSEDIDII